MDPIKYIFEKPSLSGRIAKWQVLFSEFDIVYITRKAIKGSVIADCLAELPIEDYESMKFDFPDEDIMALVNTASNTWTMMFDGATNEIGHGVRAILMSPDGKWYLSPRTRDDAEQPTS
ncbi:Retrovirus-related Pol polyprotein from transposon 17.6 [Cucumis melo var. makuwa]|uniref:Retrovirus-related Pol polyprotein from transposon 17.6 n=1 Tax=Cucumis melo var. makuwa TaxID=1194695 RepID=A0A5D3CZQ2_CUCMM|nr:Retrovirus-related Pol polyprotein from transposon 17.6 [Cucumis melo var. makuwa]TYK16840.1 Retrovirus-related Pol polyprotein from transposon 17.6 [Cucumis melo var. makuwa]